MTKNRRGKILASLVRVYLLVLVVGLVLMTHVPILAYAILPLYVMFLFLSLLGIPGLQDGAGQCFLGMCDPSPFGWVAAGLAWLSVLYALAWFIDSVVPKAKPPSAP